MYKTIFLLTAVINSQYIGAAPTYDDLIRKKFSKLGVKALEKSTPVNQDIYNLGKAIFNDTLVSGNKNISCRTCHNPEFGTSDALPFSIGEGGVGEGDQRQQGTGVAVGRSAPHLYNLGYPKDLRFMFWDGRVSFAPGTNIYKTPEESFNGENPKASHITVQFNGALSAQTIFPLTSHEEMRGQRGTNELADASSNLEVWQRIVTRLKNKESYRTLFKKAFQNQEINIGHIGRAMGDFITREFNYNDTPFDRYVKGDLEALTERQKKGLHLFLVKGKCMSCHKGKHLGGRLFTSAGVPEISLENHPMDYGFGQTTGRKRDNFKFLSRPLRNIALSAPYMHNGALKDLRTVIEHYNKNSAMLKSYNVPSEYQTLYNGPIIKDEDEGRNSLRTALIKEPRISFGLLFTEDEKEALLEFLTYGLTDYKLHKYLK